MSHEQMNRERYLRLLHIFVGANALLRASQVHPAYFLSSRGFFKIFSRIVKQNQWVTRSCKRGNLSPDFCKRGKIIPDTGIELAQFSPKSGNLMVE